MLLKRLEISGFKSFAKTAVLEFPTKITAIVGPNGSGKSNIADAIRWVLGEQSMKHLRSKKGEDLIFGGTPQVARLAKASVALVFDNKNKIFPVEFDEVSMARKVYRDGVNDYMLNDSQARLKDIIELLSKVGLGASQHHIIAQGDADRILYASPKERKSMVEEALGLKIFELKKNESRRKMDSTGENIKQAESLRREIQPHLKYLESQAEKMKNAAVLRKNLEELTGEYVSRELRTIEKEERELKNNKEPLAKTVRELEKAMQDADDELKAPKSGGDKFFDELKQKDDLLENISKRRRDLERELGRLEALSESAVKNGKSAGDAVPKEKIKSALLELVSDLESVSRSGTMDEVRGTIFSVIQKIYSFLESMNGSVPWKTSVGKPDSAELQKIKDAVAKLEAEEKDIAAARKNLRLLYEEEMLEARNQSVMLRKRMEELASAKDALRDLLAKEEKLALIKREFETDFAEWFKTKTPAGEILSEQERVDLRKKIERLRIRLEDAGGVDEGVFKEYEETKQRDEFLAKEIDDLKKTAESLKEMTDELEGRIAKDFNQGLEKINKLFGDFFREIFGGGKAEIKMQKPEKHTGKKDEEEEPDDGWQEEIEEEPGLDIFVDIPRKRIKSLGMLSGGERALTSIALLFAMSTVNPPPFLVLDETDAALDEANSNRYAAMLKELGKKTQLVVVTHNRETMRAADVLYGVTMGGDGVSKLISMKFEDAEDVLAKK